MQKFVNYRRRLAVVGDVSRQLAESSALRDFVREANRGSQLWFLADDGALDDRLNPAPQAEPGRRTEGRPRPSPAG